MSDQAIEEKIQAKGLTAPRITLGDISANIADKEIVKHVSKSGQILRWAILTTLSGYAVVGKPSVAVSQENDNAEIGEDIAFDNSINEMWPLMGYELKQRLHDRTTGEAKVAAPTSNLPPHQERVLGEKAELDEKLTKLTAFLVAPMFGSLSVEEQSRLRQQQHAMTCYSLILGERIAAFPAII